MDSDDIRKVVLEIVEKLSGKGSGFQMTSIIEDSMQRLQPQSIDEEQAILTVAHDLYRNGHISWGFNSNNVEYPFCHLTDKGRTTLANLSRDPSNPSGYLKYLDENTSLNPIALSYVQEALHTFNSNCFRASAVMIGCASESVILELRDALVSKLKNIGQKPSNNLMDWRVKRILDGLKSELEKRKKDMDDALASSFESYWPAFTQQIRTVRNEAGHPQSIDLIGDDAVHASLLIFPEIAKLTTNLGTWIESNL